MDEYFCQNEFREKEITCFIFQDIILTIKSPILLEQKLFGAITMTK